MLNNQQKYAVDARNCNLLVSASAGSGKTKVLITRIANMIANRETNISNLLVVTFTKASAIEMKERLISELSEIKQNSNDEGFKSYILSQIEEIPLCDISTIHSFCAKIVRKYFYELNLDPAFKLVDEGLDEIKLEAFNNIISNYTKANDEDFKKLFYVFNQKRNNLNLLKTVFLVSDIMHKTNNQVIEKTELCFNKNLEINSALIYLSQYVTQVSKQLLEKIKSYVSTVIITEDKFTTNLSACLTLLNSILNSNSVFEKVKIISNAKLPDNRLKENKLEYAYIKEIIKENLIDEVQKILGKNFTEADLLNQIENSSWITKKLLELTAQYQKEFYRLKEKNAILDLTDVEELMIKLLENNNVVNDLQQTYDYIFVDEYQDTNEIQEHILTKIAKQDNMFMVGDAKQSIYGFRLCDPTIFTTKYDNYKNFGFNQKINLNKNYRSNKNILDFTNKVCSKCITKNVGSINYLQDAMLETEIEIGSVKNQPSVKLFAIQKLEKETKEKIILDQQVYSVKDAPIISETENETLLNEARVIATQIISLVGQEYSVRINNEEKIKTIQYGDICILSRSKKGYLQKLANILNSYDIPVRCSFTDNLYEYFEVKILIDALKTINNYYDDVSIVSTMTNLFNFSFSELISVREEYPFEKYYYSALQQYQNNQHNDLSNKISRFFEEIEIFKLKSGYYSLFDLINELIEKQNYMSFITCQNNSKEKIENIHIFLNTLKQNKNNINEFLQIISLSVDKNEKDLSIDNGENSVKLDSIHASKGLEYPVVILTNCGKDLTRKINTDFVSFNKNIGLSCASFDVNNRVKTSNVIQQIIKFANSNEEFEENIRLLYVALTRAKNNLIIVGEVDFDKVNIINSDLDIMLNKTYMQLILGSLNVPFKTLKENNYVQLNGDIEINLIQTEKLNSNNNLTKTNEIVFKQEKLDSEDENIINGVFNYKYKFNQSTELPIKNSVSQLNDNSDIEISYNFAPKKLTRAEHSANISADKIGTAYHAVMQHISFRVKDRVEVENTLNKLVAQNILSDEDVKVIDIDKIFNCVTCLQGLISTESKVIREQPFIMLEKHCNLVQGSEIQDEILVQGIIDLLIINKQDVIVVDYKTTRLSEDDIKRIYQTQLDLYAKSVKYSMEDVNVKPIIYSFFHDKLIKY